MRKAAWTVNIPSVGQTSICTPTSLQKKNFTWYFIQSSAAAILHTRLIDTDGSDSKDFVFVEKEVGAVDVVQGDQDLAEIARVEENLQLWNVVECICIGIFDWVYCCVLFNQHLLGNCRKFLTRSTL